jgi:hypothetical protein
MTFTEFERDLLSWFVEHSTHPALADQLRGATPVSREYTGAGMYLDFSVPTTVERIPADLTSPITGPQIAAPSLTNGAGSLLWHENGVAACVEVYTYTDPFFEAPTDYSLHAVPDKSLPRPVRDR